MDLNQLKDFHLLGREFYSRDTAEVAKELLGKFLVKYSNTGKITGGYIIETEAYYGAKDPASHAYRGVTPRCAIMFGKAGISYVYFCYGFHYLLNVVTEKKGTPGAVLIRAVRPVMGIDEMISRRRTKEMGNLASGPGKLTSAFGIEIKDNGKDLTDPSGDIGIFKNKKAAPVKDIRSSVRIGIRNGADKELRFFILPGQTEVQ
ncbi:MAG: 3-methyladenine DNA glycosylase [Actinobacteria bacterium ADurb.Bin346]|nr:MAG: 3-methyladenine DNA glycosylase [Actinobacteria bacterium ADurb.Bin346]